jgi:hypothetical protein
VEVPPLDFLLFMFLSRLLTTVSVVCNLRYECSLIADMSFSLLNEKRAISPDFEKNCLHQNLPSYPYNKRSRQMTRYIYEPTGKARKIRRFEEKETCMHTTYQACMIGYYGYSCKLYMVRLTCKGKRTI